MAGEHNGRVFVDGEWIQWDDDKMEFINVESDMFGRDEITFIYEGKEHKSFAAN